MFIHTMTKICKFSVIPLLLGFPVAVIAYRLHIWGMGTSFQIIQFTGYGSAVMLALTVLIGFVAFFKNQKDAVKRSVFVAVLLAIPVIGLSITATKAKSLPFLHQVSTDTNELPQFDVIIALRGENSNPLAYDREKLAPLQQEAYPELKPIMSKFDTKLAFTKAVNTAKGLGWEIVGENPEKGIIEAVDTTSLWAFKDDIVIRIEQTETGSKIDLRSISRIGGTDLGANAARVKTFISKFPSN